MAAERSFPWRELGMGMRVSLGSQGLVYARGNREQAASARKVVVARPASPCRHGEASSWK